MDQRGSWRSGSGAERGRNRERGHKGGALCRFFLQGRCRFTGDDCRFSHDLNRKGEGSSAQSQKRLEEATEQRASKREYQSWKRILETPPTANDTEAIMRLWDQALELLHHGDRNCKQMLPRDLVDDDQSYGYQHIQILLEMRANQVGDTKFNELARPFLLVITHPDLLDCLSVDTYVGDLYNFICGSSGTRAIPFFKQLNSTLIEECLISGAIKAKLFNEMLTAITTALREVLRRIPRALFHEELPDLVESLKNSFDVVGFEKTSLSFHIINTCVTEIQRMMNRGKGLLVEKIRENSDEDLLPVVTSTYPRDLEMPGDRHDNDNTDITKIKILPTEEEIRCERAEFLPSTCIDQPHFLDGVDRLLDTHFRLLRHDIFGDLKAAIGGILSAFDEDVNFDRNPRVFLEGMHSYVYSSASISSLAFSKKCGLEAQMSFLQPAQARKKTKVERQKWWETTKRLKEGSLLCLIAFEDSKSSLLFFTVSLKKTDHNDPYGLSSSDNATVTAKPASIGDRNQLKQLIRLFHGRKTSPKNWIVEFPGVLLGTFMPILENLQHMQKFGQLPFEEWIVPKPIQPEIAKNDLQINIPPPCYARDPDFKFDLKPILTDTGSFFLDPVSAADPQIHHELQKRTSLDDGQCEALVAALTQEFALIQGPPGTGKSYLGVQLMRVLVHNKEAADLGPVIVV